VLSIGAPGVVKAPTLRWAWPARAAILLSNTAVHPPAGTPADKRPDNSTKAPHLAAYLRPTQAPLSLQRKRLFAQVIDPMYLSSTSSTPSKQVSISLDLWMNSAYSVLLTL
jgi:hypothetical protein